jgi:lysophosphatidylcholine acyltransferase/lyso-PAF acetyltransferase
MCTNRECLITFKEGAFIPGRPVQPIVIEYKNKFDCVTWTFDTTVFKMLFYSMCQFHNYMEITVSHLFNKISHSFQVNSRVFFKYKYLPVYVPNQQEIKNSKLYANNVRQLMAKFVKF